MTFKKLNKEEPLTFTLKIEGFDLKERSDSKNMFVIFEDEKVNLYSSGLSLEHVLEKVGMYLKGDCLFVNEDKFCEGNFSVNNKESYEYGNYVPEESDLVEINYLKE